jgi:RsiW-degrading membrane proteinase PrsW (M82 family)
MSRENVGEAWTQGEAQARPAWTGEYPSVDPQQPWREYTSPHLGIPPTVPPPPQTPRPTYPASHPSQPNWPGYAGQPMGIWPPTPVYPNAPAPYPNYPPHAGYPGAPGYGMPNPGYSPHAEYLGAPTYGMPNPGYPPHAGYPGAPAYGMPMYPYNYGHYGWPPPAPKRDRYLLVVGIVAFIGSCLAILAGLVCMALFALVNSVPSSNIDDSTRFAGGLLVLTLGLAGTVGGGFCLYHSIRSLFLRKPSHTIWLPRLWLFLLCYLATLGIGYWLHTLGEDVTVPILTGLLIYLSAVFPSLAILTLGIRRLRPTRDGPWPTSWRRLTLALVSGTTLAILLASILEFVFAIALFGNHGNTALQSLGNSGIDTSNPSLALELLTMLAVVAPFVEELVKPLAVIILIGRVQSKAEAFALGLACGIGFSLVETIGYISSGYNDWLNIALFRSGAGLLHGLGAAMMALGWYYLTHKEEGTQLRRLLLAAGCGAYAILQHAFWNGSWGLALIPGPIGNFVQNWTWSLGSLSIDAPILFDMVELLGILIFFIFISRRLRIQKLPQAA